jgi:hypothetical protein
LIDFTPAFEETDLSALFDPFSMQFLTTLDAHHAKTGLTFETLIFLLQKGS